MKDTDLPKSLIEHYTHCELPLDKCETCIQIDNIVMGTLTP